MAYNKYCEPEFCQYLENLHIFRYDEETIAFSRAVADAGMQAHRDNCVPLFVRVYVYVLHQYADLSFRRGTLYGEWHFVFLYSWADLSHQPNPSRFIVDCWLDIKEKLFILHWFLLLQTPAPPTSLRLAQTGCFPEAREPRHRSEVIRTTAGCLAMAFMLATIRTFSCAMEIRAWFASLSAATKYVTMLLLQCLDMLLASHEPK